MSDLYVEPTNDEIIGSFLIMKDLVTLTEQILNSQDLLKNEDLLMLGENHERGLTSERYFNALKHVTGIKGQQNKVSSVVIID